MLKESNSIISTLFTRSNFIIIKFCPSFVNEAYKLNTVFVGVFSIIGLELVFFMKPITKALITRIAVIVNSLIFIIYWGLFIYNLKKNNKS